jgi:hypothetical protein
MAQIIKHRRGSLEALSAVTASLQKGELVIASGSTNITASNGTSIVFAVPESGSVQAVNRFLIGTAAPNVFPAGIYNGMLKGVPYYASGSSTLYLLGEGSNDIPNLVGNISVFSASVDNRLDVVEASLGSGGDIGIRVSSLETSSANLNSFSSSTLVRLSNLESKSASVDTSVSNINSYTSSLKTAITLDGQNVTVNGNFTVAGTQTVVNSTTVQLGDNIIELNGTGATNGGLRVKDPTASNTVSGSLLWDSTNDYWVAGALGAESKLLRAGGDSVVSGSSQITLQSTTGFSAYDTALSTITGSLISSASADRISITNINTTTASLNTSVSNINTFSASANTRFTEIGVVSGSLISSASAASVSITNLNTFSGSQLSKDSTLATYTASVNTSISNINSFTASFGTTFSSSVDSRLDTLEGTGTIQGVGTGNNVTFASVTTTNNLTVGGDLVVQGNTVTLNTSQLVVEDKLISLASGSTNAAQADGAGIEVLGATATITYKSTPDAWQFNKPITGSAFTGSLNVPSGGGNSKRIAFRGTADNIEFVAAPTTSGDLVQWDGTNFVMSNTIDGGTF